MPHNVKVVITVLALRIAWISALAGQGAGRSWSGIRVLGAGAPAATPAAADRGSGCGRLLAVCQVSIFAVAGEERLDGIHDANLAANSCRLAV